MPVVHVFNGPNLNMPGEGESAISGHETLAVRHIARLRCRPGNPAA